MKKSTKGAIAGAAMAVLLLGGAGSLAFWTDQTTAVGGIITSGHLQLKPATAGAWSLNGKPVANPSAVRLVPGDELRFAGSYSVQIEGDDITADLSVTGATASGALADFVTTTPTFTLNGGEITSVSAANDGQLVAVGISISFPFGSEDNSSNVAGGLALDLTDVAVTLTQTHDNA